MELSDYKSDKERDYPSYKDAYKTYQDIVKEPKNSLLTNLISFDIDIDKFTSFIEKYKFNPEIEGMTTDEVKVKYDNIIQTRRELEQKLYELYNNDYDSLYSVKSLVDSSVITGILWTVLATTMIYYIIVKL